MPKYTPTQQRIIVLLSDGLPHTREELLGCLSDPLSAFATVRVHLTYLRKKIRPLGQEIICEFQAYKLYWRHVILLPQEKVDTLNK